MTVEWYRENGYEVSANLSQEIVDRLETEVKQGYIEPLIPNPDYEDERIQHILATVTFYSLCLSNAKVTRKGAKVKKDDNSTQTSAIDLAAESARAFLALDQLKRLADNHTARIKDFLNINFTSAFLGTDFINN